ncbi:hypothetical protein Bbelb_091070 [Branchiostoma belcheri]|nr:hypothetical protein Bbelb_091070 [Branchiostoma belcheri]
MSRGERTYKCDQCEFSSLSEDSLELHRAIHRTVDSLEGHNVTHSGTVNRHTSGERELTTSDNVILSMHINEQTGEAPKISDHTSGKTTRTLSTEEDYHICGECAFITTDRVVLSMHLTEHKGKEQTTACWDHTYAIPASALDMNTGDKPYLCEQCGFSSTSITQFTIHKRRHTGEKPYLCDVCGLTFVDRSALTAHRRRKHTLEKPHKCNLCDYSAEQKSCLDLHMANKHTGEKPYACELCGYRTAVKGYISVHMRIHTGDKPYRCDYCDFTAAAKNTINQHMARHDPTKYLVCKECGMRTVSKQYMKRHMAKHEKNPNAATYACERVALFFGSPEKRGPTRLDKKREVIG